MNLARHRRSWKGDRYYINTVFMYEILKNA